MLRNWTQRVFAWLQSEGSRAPGRGRRRGHRQFAGNRRGAMIHHLEALESRELLTSLVAVTVSGGAVTLTDASSGHKPTGDDFTVSYTSSQIVLTGGNGTQFQVGGQTLSTYTATVTGDVSLSMSLGSHGNAVSITGDGTSNLTSLTVDLGGGRQGNSLSLTNVVANTITVDGSRGGDSVSLNQSKVSGDLSAQLGRDTGDLLNLATTTIGGNVDATTSQFVMNGSTISGSLNDVESRRFSTFNSTSSIYNGAATIQMGRHGAINMLTSTAGVSEFTSSLSVTGKPHAPTSINQQTNSVTYDVTPTLKNASIQGATATAEVAPFAPTVVTASVPTSTPTITGTYDAVHEPNLSVTANGKTYKLGTDSELTSASRGNWSLNLSDAPLTTLTNTVTATTSDNSGNTKTGTGTITNEQAAIQAYLTANSLTATKTATGLDYVITTNGTGAIPTTGQTVNVQYTGHILNSDGTLGTEFDSNTDGTDPSSPNPFPFKLGAGAVIAGWDQAFALLPVGTVAKLLIPSQLAYKTTGNGSIGPNQILEFDVKLVSVS